MHRLTVGAMSNPSSDLPRAGGAFLEQRAKLGDVLGREQRRDPAVGDLAGERGVLGADRGEVDGDPRLHRRDRELERLARTVGERQLERLALELDALARERHAHDLDVLARALELLGEALPVPALGDLRARGADAADHAPVRELVDRRGGHRGHRGGARGHLEDARAEPDLARLPGEPAEHGGGVGAVRLGCPHRVIAELLGLLDDVELVLGGEAETPVADVHAELHVQVSFQREGFVAGSERVWNAWRQSAAARDALRRGQPMRKRRHRSSSPVESLRLAIDCMPVATREAMLAGVRRYERIIVGRLHR